MGNKCAPEKSQYYQGPYYKLIMHYKGPEDSYLLDVIL